MDFLFGETLVETLLESILFAQLSMEQFALSVLLDTPSITVFVILLIHSAPPMALEEFALPAA
jgi:hypothetical protein